MKNIKSTLAAIALSLCYAVANAAPVNINTASAQEIANALNGIGEKKAQAIVTYREQNGNFQSVEELTKVRGIGEKTVQKNQTDILLSDGKN